MPTIADGSGDFRAKSEPGFLKTPKKEDCCACQSRNSSHVSSRADRYAGWTCAPKGAWAGEFIKCRFHTIRSGIAEGKKIRTRDGDQALWTLIRYRFTPLRAFYTPEPGRAGSPASLPTSPANEAKLKAAASTRNPKP